MSRGGRTGRGESEPRSGELHTKPTDIVPEIIGDDLPPALLEVQPPNNTLSLPQCPLWLGTAILHRKSRRVKDRLDASSAWCCTSTGIMICKMLETASVAGVGLPFMALLQRSFCNPRALWMDLLYRAASIKLQPSNPLKYVMY